jgi:hypothetical protein
MADEVKTAEENKDLSAATTVDKSPVDIAALINPKTDTPKKEDVKPL